MHAQEADEFLLVEVAFCKQTMACLGKAFQQGTLYVPPCLGIYCRQFPFIHLHGIDVVANGRRGKRLPPFCQSHLQGFCIHGRSGSGHSTICRPYNIGENIVFLTFEIKYAGIRQAQHRQASCNCNPYGHTVTSVLGRGKDVGFQLAL